MNLPHHPYRVSSASLILWVVVRCALAAEPDILTFGAGADYPLAVTVDAAGNVYVAGSAQSTNLLDAPVVHRLTVNASTNTADAFVLKLDSAGAPVYLTYLGGSGDDAAYGIQVDANGCVYIAGYTTSTDFPTAHAIQSALADTNISGGDGFVAKLDASGAALVFSTYLGGSGQDWCAAIVLDPEGNVLVTGTTSSTDFWTLNALQPTNGLSSGVAWNGLNPEGSDAFIAKLRPAGTALVYATYLGGSDWDLARGLAVDRQGNAYVVGESSSTNLPTANAFQLRPATNRYSLDAFLAKVNRDGTALVYSTYLGGTATDEALAVAVDEAGRAHVAGVTSSRDFPLTRPLQSDLSGGSIPGVTWPPSDGFVTQFSADGDELVYSTYLGGNDGDSINALALDRVGNVWLTGALEQYVDGRPAGGLPLVAQLGAGGGSVRLAASVTRCGVGYGTGVALAPNGDAWVIGRMLRSDSVTHALSFEALAQPFVARVPNAGSGTNPAPLLRLARPVAGTILGTNVSTTLHATVADLGGQVQRVEFRVDAEWVGTTTNAPYEVVWRPTRLGATALEVIAVDDSGLQATSCPVRVTVVAAPPNDRFEQAEPIFDLDVTVTGTTSGASAEPGEPSVALGPYFPVPPRQGAAEARAAAVGPLPGLAGRPVGSQELRRTVWWCWAPNFSGVYTVCAQSLEASALLTIYTGYGLNDLKVVARGCRLATNSTWRATFQANYGRVFFFSMEDTGEGPGDVTLQVRLAQSPANDDFTHRMPLEGAPVTATGSNVEATSDSVYGPYYDWWTGASVWWSWIAPADGVFFVSAAGSGFYPDVAVYTGTNVDDLRAVATSQVDGMNERSLLGFNAKAGTPYAIRVASPGLIIGDLRLEITPSAPPPNDSWTRALVLTGAAARVAGTLSGASTEPGEPATVGYASVDQSVWWMWSPPTSGVFTVTLTTTNNVLVSLAVYAGLAPSNLTLIDLGRDRFDFSPRRDTVLTFRAAAGTDYYVVVGGVGYLGTDFELRVEPVRPPANDGFENRIMLAGPAFTVEGSNVNATRDTGEPDFPVGGYTPRTASVWWSWTAPEAGRYLLELESDAYDLEAVFLLGDVLTNLGYANYQTRVYPDPPYQNLINVLSNTTYQIRVSSGTAAPAGFRLSLRPAARPLNDDFTNRLELSGPVVQLAVDTLGATMESGERSDLSCSGWESDQASVWWTWTAPSNGLFALEAVDIRAAIPVVAIYTGADLVDLSTVVGDRDLPYTFSTEVGVTYQIRAAGCVLYAGDLMLRLRPAQPPVNDHFTNRIRLTGSQVIAFGTNVDATAEPGEPWHYHGGYGRREDGHTLWWEWTAPASGPVSINATVQSLPRESADSSIIPMRGSVAVAVYTGSSLSTLTNVARSDYGVIFQAVAGRTYQIAVEGSGVMGQITLTILGPTPAEPARIVSVQPTPGGTVQLEIAGTAWRTHRLEVSTNLTDWSELTSLSSLLYGPVMFDWNASHYSTRFYRLRTD